MNGCTIPYTPIAVDFWKVRQLQRVRLFFLSHVNLDPSCGITSSWSMPIYCSPVSKKLLLQRFQLNQDVVHALELNVPHVIPITSKGDVTMTVTLIDANHCPGSVMFLFEGYFGRILYTGDFRYTENMMTTSPFCDIVSKPIDVLYLDNTYCSQKCSFPPREFAEREIISAIEQHPNDKIVIGLRNFGKEDLLIALAAHFGVTIKVSEERFKTLELLNAHEHFSASDGGSRIEVVPLVDVTRQNMDAWNKERPTTAILPTSLFTALGDFPYHGQKDMVIVPYSDHSSYAELHRFVAAVKPKSIIPIVKADGRDPLTSALLDRASVECFLEYLDKTPMTNYHIPPAVLELMNQTPSRGGSSRKGSAARKTISVAKGQKGGSRNKKGNENVPCTSASTCAVVPFLSEAKTRSIIDANHSNVAAIKCQVLEKPRIEIFSNQNGGFKNCAPVQKSDNVGTKLSRCDSTDRLDVLGHRPHAKRFANGVASSDLRMQLKRKAEGELKDESTTDVPSNLVRTRRVRLCNAILCRTFCHSSKNCRSFSDKSFSDERVSRGLDRIEPVSEANGDESMNRFRQDSSKKHPNVRVANGCRETNRCSPHSNSEFSSASSSPSDRSGGPACSFPMSTNEQFSCLSSTTCDVPNKMLADSSLLLPSSSHAGLNSMTPAEIIDLRSRGAMSSQCVMLTSLTPQIQDLNGLNRDSQEHAIYPPGVGLSVLVPTIPVYSERDLTGSHPGVSFTGLGVNEFRNFRHAAAMLQLRQDTDGMSDSSRRMSWSVGSSGSSSMTFSDTIDVDGPAQDLEETSPRINHSRPIDDHRRKSPDPGLESSRVLNHEAVVDNAGTAPCSYGPSVDTQFMEPSGSLYRAVGTAALQIARRSSTDYQFASCFSAATETPNGFPRREIESPESAECNEATPTKIVNGFTSSENHAVECTTGTADSTSCLPLPPPQDLSDQAPESALPPKKNWRHRFRLAQSHSDSKRLKSETNGISKLIVASGKAIS